MDSTKLIEVARTNGKLELTIEIQTWILSKGGKFSPEEFVKFLDEKVEELNQ